MTFEKKEKYPLSMFECFEHVIVFFNYVNFEHVNFAIKKKNPKNNYDNANYYASLVIFQNTKM
jgi:hypothetical protein